MPIGTRIVLQYENGVDVYVDRSAGVQVSGSPELLDVAIPSHSILYKITMQHLALALSEGSYDLLGSLLFIIGQERIYELKILFQSFLEVRNRQFR